MKITTTAAITNAAIWLGVTAAIITAIVLTGKTSVLWFYIVPAVCTLSVKTNTGKGEEDADK